MKKIMIAIFCVLGLSASSQKLAKTTDKQKMERPSIYDQNFKVQTLTGETFNLSSLKGKKVMIVNTASKCGLTPQYEELEQIYNRYKEKGFVVVGFPANNFAEQEPGSNKEIAEFCKMNYGVTFPMMSKISVKGDDMDAVYKWLTQKSKNGLQDSEVEWNFQKYLLNEKGELVKVVAPRTTPSDEKIINWITTKEL